MTEKPRQDSMSVMGRAIDCLRDGILTIDSEGRIWRHKNANCAIESRRAENVGSKGYLRLTLGIPGTNRTRSVLAHRVVWVWLHGLIPNNLQINHKDLNKTNNRPDNLELVTGSENILHSYANGRPRPWHKTSEWRGRPKLTPDQAAEILRLRRSGLMYRQIADQAGFSIAHVHRIIKREGG